MNFRLGAFSLHSRRLWHFGPSWPSQTEELEGKLKLRTAKTKWSSGVHAVSSTTAAVITISNGCVERGTQQQHPSSSHVMFDKIRGGGGGNPKHAHFCFAAFNSHLLLRTKPGGADWAAPLACKIWSLLVLWCYPLPGRYEINGVVEGGVSAITQKD